jgi:hypothetical protein
VVKSTDGDGTLPVWLRNDGQGAFAPVPAIICPERLRARSEAPATLVG